jgi:predicted O-linked N-acetylglucosamine transferase (SPINDLY family)
MPQDPASEALASAFALSRSGRLDEALAALAALLARAPREPRAHALHGRVLALRGDAVAARAAVARALALDPACAPAWVEEAALARAAGDREAATAALEKLVALAPDQPAFWFDLGVLRAEAGQADAAASAFDRTLALAPTHADAQLKRANLDAAAGRSTAAIAGYRRCLALRPGWIEALLNLGEQQLAAGDAAAALASWRAATTAAPTLARAWDGRARAAKAARQLDEMLAARRRCTELDDSPPAWALLGTEHLRTGDIPAAREAFGAALARDPAYLPARWAMFQYPQDQVHRDEAAMAHFRAQWLDGLAWFEALPLESLPADALVGCITLATEFYLHYLGEPFVAEQRRYGALLERMMAHAFRGRATPTRRPRADGRRRIGFCSAFLRTHTVTKLFASLPGALDRSRWEVNAFHLADLVNEGTDAWRAHAEHFEHGEHDLGAWIDRIRARDLDLLVYVDIGMHPLVQGLASMRLAPVQAALWGHPIGSGRHCIDHFLTSDAMEIDGGERFYGEQLVRLPGLGTCYAPPTRAPKVPPELAARDADRVHFFVAQQAVKLLPLHDALFARIAAALPAACFHFVPSPFEPVRRALRERLAASFASAGLDFERHCGVFRFVDQAEFLGIGATADANLDSIGWSGGNTTLEILWHDTPTVTLPGELMRSRHTVAMLRILELPQLIARDLDDYVRIAVELGRSPGLRAELRGLIAERKHRLYDDPRIGPAFAAFAEGVARG